MRVSRLLYRLPIVFLCFDAGCASLDQPSRDLLRLSLPDQAQRYDKFKDNKELVERFLACSGETYQPSGAQPPDLSASAFGAEPERAAHRAAALVSNALDLTLHEARQELRAQIRTQIKDLVDVNEHTIPHGALAVKLKERLKHVSIGVGAQRVALHRYAKLLAATPQLVEYLHARIQDDEDRIAQTGTRFERLLVAYNKAYFGEIAFKEASGAVGAEASHIRIKKIVRSVSDGFVDRNGARLAFPGLPLDELKSTQGLRVHVGSADSRRVASDLTRIFVEALFDAAFQVPAIDGATALKITGFGFPRFDAENPPIPVDDFAKLTTDGLRTEAAITSHIGELVRGGGGLGINNETLASMIETAAGVIARKLTEHELFCYYRATSGTAHAGSSDTHDSVQRVAEDLDYQ
ncbi:MAG: hypothetical protein F9K13_02560 [Candidatus Methylomirabilis oxygeniifera]|uniref:Uncharacterized protein n=1 Tax=Methylomirabilis oxygeniifera TaxID=671143 RepID=D5MF33_METO1|nr:MAG: hypothetical protein F9K13_02560 [Candidatus Methylomirabilis oxyfera]CBE68362.1 protein of unknown function [Candidatus Methylomirabilis oxyfera]